VNIGDELVVGRRRGRVIKTDHCYSPEAATYRSATAISQVLEELVGQCDSVQRSLLFLHVGLEQGADQLHISLLRARRVKRSNRRLY
jgi:hypothetical protein